MGVRYYSNLYEMEDTFRNKKYYSLLIASLQNDTLKWTADIQSDKTIYRSPLYNTSKFVVELRSNVHFANVYHIGTPPITDRQSELISDSFPTDLKNAVNKLRESVYTSEIYEIEKLVGTQNGRKEKLQFLELEQIRDLIEDTYNDWLNNSSDLIAKFIAKLMFSYRKKEEIFELWNEKFGENELIMSELKKLKG